MNLDFEYYLNSFRKKEVSSKPGSNSNKDTYIHIIFMHTYIQSYMHACMHTHTNKKVFCCRRPSSIKK